MIQKQPTWWAENGQPRQKKSILSRVTVSVQQRVTTPIPYMSIAKPSKSWRTKVIAFRIAVTVAPVLH